MQGFVHMQRGIDGTADADERFQKPGLESGLFKEPGVVNHLGRLHRQFLQQFLVALAECIRVARIHVEHATHLSHDFQRHGQLRTDIRMQHDVARITSDVADAGRACPFGQPSPSRPGPRAV
jgi:hypothetical protein